MPGNLLDADTSFPEIRGKRQEDINREVLNYLGMLLEQLRYSFANIGLQNFNETEFEHISELIQEPIYARLQDDEGNMAQLSATAQGLIGRISDAEGSITSLAATAQGLATEVSDVSGKYTRLSETVEGFTFQDDEGKVWINNGSINLTGSITFNDLDSSVQSAVNNRGISAATAESIAHTAISADLVASPKIMGADIYGGTYWDSGGNVSLTMEPYSYSGVDSGCLRVKASRSTLLEITPIFMSSSGVPWEFDGANVNIGNIDVLETALYNKSITFTARRVFFGGNLYDYEVNFKRCTVNFSNDATVTGLKIA